MKLTQRQLDKISSLINEEAEVRKNLHESMYENRKLSLLNEAPELDLEAVPDYDRMRAEDEYSRPNDLFNDFIKQINIVVYSALSEYMKQAEKEDREPKEWESEMHEIGGEAAEIELFTDLSLAVTSYAQNVAQIAVDSMTAKIAVDSMTAKDNLKDDDLESRYSEYE